MWFPLVPLAASPLPMLLLQLLLSPAARASSISAHEEEASRFDSMGMSDEAKAKATAAMAQAYGIDPEKVREAASKLPQV